MSRTVSAALRRAVLPGCRARVLLCVDARSGRIDVEEIATALADQTDYEHRRPVDSRTCQVGFWTSDTGIDGQNPVEIDELDLIVIDPLPPSAWFQGVADLPTTSATAWPVNN